MMSVGDLNRVFLLVASAIIVFVVLAFIAFMYWARRDRDKRDAAIRFYNRRFGPDQNRDED